jgi:ATP-dependent DNA helicase RecG
MDIIVNAIKANSKITRSELAKIIGKSKRTIQGLLESNPKIKYVGSGNNDHWEIKE